MADVGDELTAGFLRGLNAGDVVENDKRATGRQRGGVDLEDPARAQEGWRGPTQSSRRSRAPRTQASSSGSRTEWTSGRPGRSCDPAMRCMTALDQRTKPAEVMATTASCMESSMTASSCAAAFELGKVLARGASAVSIEGGSTIERANP